MIQCLVNPLCLFLGVWGVATVLYLGGVLAGTFPLPQPLTVGALLLNLGTFSLGYLTWSLFRSLSPPTGAALGPAKPLTEATLVRALTFTLVVGGAALAMELHRFMVLASHLHTNWQYLVTHPAFLRLRLMLFISSNIFQANYLVMLQSLMNSIFSIGFVLLGVFLYTGRTRWKYIYLVAFLLISFTIGLLHVSRYEVTANILLLVFAYCFMCSRSRWQGEVSSVRRSRVPLRTSHFKLLLPLAAIALLFLAIDLLLRKSADYAQANRLEGFLYHLYWYAASPLGAFNEFLTAFRGDYSLGQNTFFPFYKWLCRLHLAQPAEIDIWGEKMYIPFVANTYTYLRNFYEDFGVLGVALVPYALGWTAAAVRQRACRCFHYLNLYIVLLMFILFSFYNFFLSSNQIYLQILFGLLFFRYEFRDYDEART